MVPSPIAAHLHDAAWRPRHRPAHEQEVVLGDDLDDLEAALGHAAAAHAARPADALEHARRRGRRADRAGLADVVRAVALGAGGEVVALDRALEALALRGPRDLDHLAGLEDVDPDLVADLQLARLAAELGQPPQRWRPGLAQVPELGLGQRLLAHVAERELDRVVPVAFGGADAGDLARAGLEHGNALDVAVLSEPLRHAELAREDPGHRATPVGSRCRRRLGGGRGAGASRPSSASADGCR